ncbi:MAG: DUF3597 domain-containing protein [Anaerolineae bacterium]|nr:DUF3597 domain-containing protein [Anaerolineae bacterium]
MSFFSKILGKLGIGKKEEDKPQMAGMAKPADASKGPAPAKPASGPSAMARPAMAKDDDALPASKAMSEVDVVAKLEGLAKANPAKLNWKVSIVDLLKLLDLDSSSEARKELATELGCPADLMGDSAKMNTWLHKEVLRKIAANGGNIPKELLD